MRNCNKFAAELAVNLNKISFGQSKEFENFLLYTILHKGEFAAFSSEFFELQLSLDLSLDFVI